jgi:hypothetical protein
MATTGTPQPDQASAQPQVDPVAQLRAWQQAQAQNAQQMAPNLAHTQQQVQQPDQESKTARGGKAGAIQNLGATIQNVVGKATQAVQQRKATEQQHVFDRFVNATQGIQAAQSQMQQAQAANKQALAKFQAATSPQDKQAAQQEIQATAGKLREAQDAMQQNRSILDTEFNPADPKGQKNIKMLSKGFGIDDKNKDTPERQAAIKAMQKKMGVGPGPAGVMAQLPQTQQPVPGQQQNKPATEGQLLKAATDTRGQDLRARANQAALLEKNGVSSAYIQLRASKEGQVAEKGADGNWQFRPMTPEEKSVYGAAQAGKIAWTMKDGKPVSVLRNPQTNQIIPGSENPALLPPSYLTDHIHEGNYFWTDNDGNIHETPTTSTTRPALPGQAASMKHTVTPMNPRGPKPDASGGDKIIGKGKSTPLQNELRMNFEKSYEKPAEDVEKSYTMMDGAYKEYEAAKAQGKELPTGAQSMLALSTHLSTTFGNVKGARVTKDMIQHHLGARSISDDALVAVQKLTNGDPLSASQWDAFHDLVSQSRKEQWTIASKEAKRAKVPNDFTPPDLLKQGVGAPEGFQPGRDGAYLGSDHKTVVGWQIDGKYQSE